MAAAAAAQAARRAAEAVGIGPDILFRESPVARVLGLLGYSVCM